VIRTEEQLWEYVKNGYKPYLMKSVNRWYLRRGRERHIIDRSLEPLAKSIRERMLEAELPPVPVSVIQDMRELNYLSKRYPRLQAYKGARSILR
jgi:hypothetical protein